MSRLHFKSAHSGFSLLEVVVAAGMMGFLAIVAATMVRNSVAEQKQLALQGEKIDARNVIKNRFSCEKTDEHNASCGESVTLYTHDDRKIGSDFLPDFSLEAKCREDFGVKYYDVFLRHKSESAFQHINDGIPIACHVSTCKYMDVSRIGSEDVEHKITQPPMIGPTAVSPIPLPAFLYPHEATILFMTGGPRFDVPWMVTRYPGAWIGNNYRFGFTAYKEIPINIAGLAVTGVDEGPLFGWVFTITGQRLVEVEYLVTIKNANSGSCTIETQQAKLVSRGSIYGDASGCFTGDTLITLADGSQMPAKFIREGDEILLANREKTASVSKVRVGPEEHPLIVLHTSQRKIRLTRSHPILSNGRLVMAYEVARGEILATETGLEKVLRIDYEMLPADEMVYNFMVNEGSSDPEDHLIIANDLMVGDLYLQTQMEQDH